LWNVNSSLGVSCAPAGTALRISHNVFDKCITEKSKIQAHYGANGKHGKRSQVQRIQRTFSGQTRTCAFRPLDRPNVRLQGKEKDKKCKR